MSIVLATVVAASANTSATQGAGPSVVITRIAGSKECRKTIEAMLGPQFDRVDWHAFSGDDPRPKPEEMEATAAWVRAGAARTPDADVAIVASKFGSKLRLDVYALPDARLIALKTFRLKPGCKVTRRVAALGTVWLDGLVHSVAPTLEADPIEDPTASALPDLAVVATSTALTEVAPVTEATPIATTATAAATAAIALAPSPPVTESGTESIARIRRVRRPAVRQTFLGDVEINQPVLAVQAMVGIAGRKWGYVRPTTPGLRGYELDAMPAPAVQLEVFPLAGLRPRFLAPLGIAAGYRRSVGVTSVRTEGSGSYPTTFSEAWIEARYRWVLAQAGSTVLTPRVGFRKTAFTLGAAEDGATEGDLPNVGYPSIAFGIQIELPIKSRITLIGDAAYLLVTSPSEQLAANAFFSESSASGFVVDAGLRFHIAGAWHAQLSAGFMRYFLAFEADTNRAADGARDEFLTFAAGLRWEH